MKSTMRLFVIVFACLALALAGCSAGSNTKPDPSTNDEDLSPTAKPVDSAGMQEFTYWYPWGGDSETWDKWRIAEFEKDHPGYKVNSVYVPPDSGISNGKLLAAIAGGTPPDVIQTNDGGYFLASQGALEPIDAYLEEMGFDKDELIETFHPIMKYKDHSYFYPMDSNVSLLYYNVQMFREAGLDPDRPPTTIEELDQAAQALSKVEGNKIERLGFIPWVDGGDDAFLLGWIFGATFYDTETDKVTIHNQPLIDMYNWMKTYARKYNPEKIKSFTSGFGGAFSPDHPFFSGKVAMTVNGNWFANALKLYAPDVEYRVAPIPAPEGGRKNATTLATNLLAIPKGAKNPAAAMKFIVYATQPRINADNINTWRSLSVYKNTGDEIVWNTQEDQVYEVVRKVASNPESGHPVLSSVANEMSNTLKLIRDSVIYNNSDPAELLKKAQADLQETADRSKK